MSMKQGDAVYQAVLNVCGVCDGAYVPTKEQRASVKQIIYEGFKSGAIVLSKNYDDKELMEYIPGLISNWLRKDKRLNGGVKYEAKNPGSRTGVTDPQLVAMRSLLATKSDPTERSEIQAFIDRRTAELKPAATPLNIDDLPEALKHLA